jgi:hypothetical protein
MMSYVYIESERWTDSNGTRRITFTVGHYKPDGKFEPDSDHGYRENAAVRVHYLNGGMDDETASSIKRLCDCMYEHGLQINNSY